MRNKLQIEWNDEGAIAVAEGFEGVMLTCPRCQELLPRNTAHRCGDKAITLQIAKATVIAHWPGNDVPACADHLQKLAGVAAVMGFRLAWTEITEGDLECTNCANEAKKAAAKAGGSHDGTAVGD